jgi:hypothetical protein
MSYDERHDRDEPRGAAPSILYQPRDVGEDVKSMRRVISAAPNPLSYSPSFLLRSVRGDSCQLAAALFGS